MVHELSQVPPRNGEGDHAQHGGGGPSILKAAIKLVKRARKLRKELSLPEVLLWRQLQTRPGGYKFRRQFPLKRIIGDFACLGSRLTIEVVGGSHNFGDRHARDIARDLMWREAGFEVLRVPAREVLKNMDGVVQMIVARCAKPGPHHHSAALSGPPPRSGEDLA
jgi:very-short-patch-repair endonuclease